MNGSRFIAIPVVQGDAFFLETPSGSVLVDGGRSIQAFPDLFRSATKRKGVDILVATHNDADHANGVLGFLRSGLQCREVWLPGRWAQVLPQTLQPWEEVVGLLFKAIADLPEEISSLEEYAEQHDGKHVEGEEIECDKRGWPSLLADMIEEACKRDEEGWGVLPRLIWVTEGWYEVVWPKPFIVLKTSQALVFSQALVAAQRIREIAIAAFNRGVSVRWFEHCHEASGGVDWLRPVNAQQVATMRVPKAGELSSDGFLFNLFLTVHNRESLVFWAPPPSAACGVLFTADSDLSDAKLPNAERPIVTAPHHGSSANQSAYQVVCRSFVNPIWVRSDGRFKGRPCREYLNQSDRFCTLCRRSNRPKQPVVFFGCGGRWQASVPPCQCK